MLQSMAIVDEVIGTWEYTAVDLPPEYAKGEILISSDADSYNIIWSFQGSEIGGQDVVVNGGDVRFSLLVEDTTVKVILKVKGDTFEGKAIHYDGEVILMGKRKP